MRQWRLEWFFLDSAGESLKLYHYRPEQNSRRERTSAAPADAQRSQGPPQGGKSARTILLPSPFSAAWRPDLARFASSMVVMLKHDLR